MEKARWEVHTKGGWNDTSFEICVIKSDNHHGKRSYGWIGEDKLLISHNGGPCHDTVTEMVWNKLVQVAQEVADELNHSRNI